MAKSSGGRGGGRGNHPANQKNPNNSAHKDAQSNQANQGNPNNPAHQSSRQGNQPPARKK